MTKNNLKPSKYLHHIVSHITAKLIVSLVPKAPCNYMTIAHVKYIDSCKISSWNFQCLIDCFCITEISIKKHFTVKSIPEFTMLARSHYQNFIVKLSMFNRLFLYNRTGSMRYQLRNILHVLINSWIYNVGQKSLYNNEMCIPSLTQAAVGWESHTTW